ncbi:MAG: hypothetical protein ACRDT6_20215, partial [Micromonosporaceae bacterium]
MNLTPVIGRVGLAAGLLGAVALPGLAAAAPPAQAAPVGGFSLRAQSSVLSVELYEPTIPIPTEPQAELNLAYTRSTISTGPDGRGTASWLWPGDAVGDGFGIIVGDPDQKWPSQVNARTPDGEEKQELTPGSGMRTAATSGGVTAKVNLIGVSAPPDGAPGLPGLPAPPPGSVPVSPGMAVLATAEGVTSSTAVTAKPGGVTATAHTAAKNIRLLGGLITVETVDTSSTSGSTASSATAAGLATVTGVTVAGKKLGIDSRGVHLADQGAELPGVPKQLADQMKALGIEISALPTTRTVKGAAGSLATSGLVITVDTRPLRSKLDTSPLDPIIGLLPQELRDQLNLILGLGPKLVFTVGEAQSSAAATPPAPLPELPDDPGVPGGGAAPAGGVPAGGAAPGG